MNPLYQDGQYLLHTMFPEKNVPSTLVKIDGVHENSAGEPVYFIAYTLSVDTEYGTIKCGGGGSGTWAENCFAPIKDPKLRLIAERQQKIDKIEEFRRKAAFLEKQSASIYYALTLLQDKTPEQEAHQ